jgi:hypothetical protein
MAINPRTASHQWQDSETVCSPVSSPKPDGGARNTRPRAHEIETSEKARWPFSKGSFLLRTGCAQSPMDIRETERFEGACSHKTPSPLKASLQKVLHRPTSRDLRCGDPYLIEYAPRTKKTPRMSSNRSARSPKSPRKIEVVLAVTISS